MRLLRAGPSMRGPLWSPDGAKPASSAASMYASATGCRRSGSQTGIGPSAPWCSDAPPEKASERMK